MTPNQVTLVQDSFAKVVPIKDTAAELFYTRLFEIDPKIRPMFSGDMKEQGRKLMAAIGTVVAGLKNPEDILPAVQELGVRHAGYGVAPSHYDTVAQALIWTLEQGLGEAFTDDVKKAWVEAYTLLSKVMIEAAENAAQQQPTPNAAPNKPAKNKVSFGNAKMEPAKSPESSPTSDAPNDVGAVVDAIRRSQAVIKFTVDGTILDANDLFLGAMGYTLDEVKGKHHSMFAEPAFAASQEYKDFRKSLNDGKFQAAEYKRLGKGGKEVWIQASYNPILDASGKPRKVIKFATDITAQKLQNADYQGQIEAIGKSQATIEFDMDGTIRVANNLFLDAMGYSLDEVVGKHHSMFAEPAFAASREYKEFWEKLKRGEFQAAEYKRLGKGGKEVWIQASYNPILDLNGNPVKVVKYATDITDQKLRNADFEGQIEAIGKSQATIEFNMDGTIRVANDHFLAAMGYSLDEVAGKHHRMFAEPALAASSEYKEFWEKLNRGEF